MKKKLPLIALVVFALGPAGAAAAPPRAVPAHVSPPGSWCPINAICFPWPWPWPHPVAPVPVAPIPPPFVCPPNAICATPAPQARR